MATRAHSTPASEPVSFEAAAAMEWHPIPLDLAPLKIAPETLNNPHMVHVRTAAALLSKTKAELIEVVKELGGLEEKGGEVAVLMRGMHETEALFQSFVQMLRSADARVFSATCAAVIAEDAE